MFTVSSIPKRCWSTKLEPMKIDKSRYNSATIAVAAAITEDGGVVYFQQFKRALD